MLGVFDKNHSMQFTHTLGAWLEQKGFTGQFDVQRRAQEVPVEEYVALVQAIKT